MSVGRLSSEAANNQLGGLYLPAIGFGFLFVQDRPHSEITIPHLSLEISIYLVGFFGALLSGVLVHEFIKSFSGPNDGPPKPMAKSTLIQRIGFTIGAIGVPENYPDDYTTPLWQSDIEVPLKRYIVFLGLIIATVVITFSHIFLIWKMFEYAVNNESLLAAAIPFFQIVFILQLLVSGIFPKTYLLEYYSQPSISERLEELMMYINQETLIEIKGGGYESEDGGRLSMAYETKAESTDEEQDIFESLITAYAGIILPDDFPCQEFYLTVYDDGSEVAEYRIGTASVEEFKSGEKNLSVIIDEVLDSLEFIDTDS